MGEGGKEGCRYYVFITDLGVMDPVGMGSLLIRINAGAISAGELRWIGNIAR